MSDVEKYIKKRQQLEPKFAEGFESGYASFKIGVLLAQAREEAGITKKELARKLNKHQSLISRIENHAENVGISTLEKYANALGKKITIDIS